MSRDFNGSTQYLYHATPAVTSTGFSVAAWVNTDSIVASQSIWCCARTAAHSGRFILAADMGNSFGGGARKLGVATEADSGGGFNAAFSTAQMSASTWHHCGGVWASSSPYRAAYLDGVRGTDNSSVVTTPSVDNMAVGRLHDASPNWYFDGRIAECAVWDAELTDAEMAALASRASPLTIRPQSLVAYWPIYGRHSPEIDVIGAFPLTLNGTPGQSDHPPIIRRRRAQIFVPLVAGGGGAVDLIVQDATHGHTADGVSLTQQHQLAVQDASHAHSADNLTLSVETALDIAESLHGHVADNLTITQEHVLAVADALHAHAADQCDVNSIDTLVVSEGLHAHAADNLVLTQDHFLVIAEAAHAHLADNIDLTQAHVLAIVEALHAHAAENVTLAEGSNNVWDEILENGLTARELMRLFAAALVGNASGLEGANPIFRSLDDSKDRITATYSGGTRTVTSRDAS